MGRGSTDAGLLCFFLLVVWQAAFVGAVIRRSPRIGFAVAATVTCLVMAIVWAGSSAATGLALTTLVSTMAMVPLLIVASAQFRAITGSFCLAGLVIVACTWLDHEFAHWRMVIVCAALAVCTAVCVYRVLAPRERPLATGRLIR